MPDKHTIELHFQDGFSGEIIEIVVNGAVVASFTAKTRYQINLAKTHELTVGEGQSVSVRLPQLKIGTEIPVDKAFKYYVISKVGEAINVKRTGEMPKYL